jgi:predicted nucleotidyltransferase
MISNRALATHRDEILWIAGRHGAHTARVSGSIARGSADAQSDIDFLADLEPGRSQLDLGGLLMELRELLGRRVDIVTGRALRDRNGQDVPREAIPLREATAQRQKHALEAAQCQPLQ